MLQFLRDLFRVNPAPAAADLPGGAGVPVGQMPASGRTPPWMALALADLGIREIAGPASNPEIMRAWEYCDYSPPDGDETSWCSAKMNEWLQRAGMPGTRQPNARSWERYGKQVSKPERGCIAVLWRGSPSS